MKKSLSILTALLCLTGSGLSLALKTGAMAPIAQNVNLYDQELKFALSGLQRHGIASAQAEFCTKIIADLKEALNSPTNRAIASRNGRFIDGIEFLNENYHLANIPYLRLYNMSALSNCQLASTEIQSAIDIYEGLRSDLMEWLTNN